MSVCVYVSLLHGAMFLSVSCDCAISWSNTFCICNLRKALVSLHFFLNFWLSLPGKQANCFSLGASWAPKTKLLGAQPKTKEPRIWHKMKLISIPYGIAKHLLYLNLKSKTLKICIPLNIYNVNSIWNQLNEDLYTLYTNLHSANSKHCLYGK